VAVSKYTGANMVVKFGTLNVSGQGRNLEINQSADEIDVTSYGSSDKEFILGKTERDGTLEILDDAASSVVRKALAVGSIGSLTWFPIGTTSGNPQLACATVLIREQNLSYPYDDAVTASVTLRLSGPVVEGTAP
jgi:predicted secreted protein